VRAAGAHRAASPFAGRDPTVTVPAMDERESEGQRPASHVPESGDDRTEPGDRDDPQAGVGGVTAGGSGEAHTLGHGTSGGDDYTAINPGGTSLSEDDAAEQG
jgi:hypothetical protein